MPILTTAPTRWWCAAQPRSRKKPAQAPTPKAHPAAEDEYAALLRQLREVNDAIPDPVMSQKISRLEEVSGRIFALAQKDPDKKHSCKNL